MVDVYFCGTGQWYAELDNDTLERDQPASCSISRNYEANGVFRLTEDDERKFRHTNSLETLGVAFLERSDHPDDEYLRMYNKDGVVNQGSDEVYFYINEDQPKPIILKIIESNKPKNSDTVKESERATLLKLIIGMAIDAYGYNPNLARNPATGDKNGISAKLETHGIIVSDDTIRKYLKEAKELNLHESQQR